MLTMATDSDEPTLYSKPIDFTDFPLDSIKIYCVDGVIMLPSEY